MKRKYTGLKPDAEYVGSAPTPDKGRREVKVKTDGKGSVETSSAAEQYLLERVFGFQGKDVKKGD